MKLEGPVQRECAALCGRLQMSPLSVCQTTLTQPISSCIASFSFRLPKKPIRSLSNRVTPAANARRTNVLPNQITRTIRSMAAGLCSARCVMAETCTSQAHWPGCASNLARYSSRNVMRLYLGA